MKEKVIRKIIIMLVASVLAGGFSLLLDAETIEMFTIYILLLIYFEAVIE